MFRFLQKKLFKSTYIKIKIILFISFILQVSFNEIRECIPPNLQSQVARTFGESHENSRLLAAFMQNHWTCCDVGPAVYKKFYWPEIEFCWPKIKKSRLLFTQAYLMISKFILFAVFCSIWLLIRVLILHVYCPHITVYDSDCLVMSIADGALPQFNEHSLYLVHMNLHWLTYVVHPTSTIQANSSASVSALFVTYFCCLFFGKEKLQWIVNINKFRITLAHVVGWARMAPLQVFRPDPGQGSGEHGATVSGIAGWLVEN